MKLALYVKTPELMNDERLSGLTAELAAAGAEVYCADGAEDFREGTDMLLSVGGDGTFLSAAKRVGDRGIPVLGVNLGRLGFLSENDVDDVVAHLPAGEYSIEDRELLKVVAEGLDAGPGYYPYALNEVSVHRCGAAMLGISVTVDGQKLPVYWADGLLVATSSGSTAYSLSVGGPICMPESKVLIIAPIAPHNLNVRPLIVPDSTSIDISVQSRDGKFMLSMDNRTETADTGTKLSISMAQFSLKRVRLKKSNFVKALTSKLFWGEDVRNGGEQ